MGLCAFILSRKSAFFFGGGGGDQRALDIRRSLRKKLGTSESSCDGNG